MSDTKQRVLLLRSEIETLGQTLEKKKQDLAAIYSSCRHDWEPEKYDPIRRKAYTISGDPVGTMGVDWQGPTYVPAEVIDRWKRTCKNCDLTEETKNVTSHITKVPKFN